MTKVETNLAIVDTALGPKNPLPRDNGHLVFEEPWQGRALGMAVVALDRAGVSWADFRHHLASAIALREPDEGETPATAYYAAWLDAIRVVLSESGALE